MARCFLKKDIYVQNWLLSLADQTALWMIEMAILYCQFCNKISEWHFKRYWHQLTFRKHQYFALYTTIYMFALFFLDEYFIAFTREQMQTKRRQCCDGNSWFKMVRLPKYLNNRWWKFGVQFWSPLSLRKHSMTNQIYGWGHDNHFL